MLKEQHKNTINKTQGNMTSTEPSCPATTNPGYPNETEAQEEDFKFNLMKLIKAFKKDMNKFLKEIHENTFKQVKALKEEANKHKEIQENIVKQVKDMNKTVS